VGSSSKTLDEVRELYVLPQDGWVADVAWSPDGLTLAAALPGTGDNPGAVQLWDAVNGARLRTFDSININRLAFSADGQWLAAAGRQVILVWRLSDGSAVINIPLSTISENKIAFSADSRIFAYSSEATLHLLEMPGGGELHTLAHEGQVMDFVILPDGKSLISAASVEGVDYGDTQFMIWDVENGQALDTFMQPGGINELEMTPDGSTLAGSFSMQTLRIWEAPNGEERQSISGFRFGIPRFAFSADGSVLAAGEGRGFEKASPSGLRLFDWAAGREIPMLEGHTGVITSVAFSADGRYLATASEDRTVRLWGIPVVP
jgi:WD40 repeat protein